MSTPPLDLPGVDPSPQGQTATLPLIEPEGISMLKNTANNAGANALLDVPTVTRDHRRLAEAWRARGVADAERYGAGLLTMSLPVSAEIKAVIETRLHELGAAREAVLIETSTFLEGAPPMQQSAQRRVAAAEAAMEAAGVPAAQVALDPPSDPPPPAGGLLQRILRWLMEDDDSGEAQIDRLRRTRLDAVVDLRKAERDILEAHGRCRHAQVVSVYLAHAEQALAQELWAAYIDGAYAGLPGGAMDFGGAVPCRDEPPMVALPAWAEGGRE